MSPSYFDYIFGSLKTKSTRQARIKPENFVNFRPEPEPDPKSQARLTTMFQEYELQTIIIIIIIFIIRRSFNK